MVLLVACANVASLLLSRAVSRQREVAVRVDIGAAVHDSSVSGSPNPCCSESAARSAAFFVVWWTTPLLHTFVLPEAVDLSVNARVLGFTLIVGVGSGLLFGLAPAFQCLRRDTLTSLRAEGGAIATGARAARLRGAFVMLQVAVSLVLLVGAGLFLRTLNNAYSIDLGYRIDRVLVGSLNLEARGYFEGGPRGPEAGLAVYEEILSRVEALPGVVAASAARMTVLSGSARSTAISTDGRPIEKDSRNALGVRANVVSHRYFETMNIPILRGRPFGPSDRPGTTRVTVVTKSLADRSGQARTPSARHCGTSGFNFRSSASSPIPSTRARWNRKSHRRITCCWRRISSRASRCTSAPLTAQWHSCRGFEKRCARSTASSHSSVRNRSATFWIERSARSGCWQPWSASLVRSLVTGRLGLYGVMAHVASQRTAEIGIRLAMGAPQGSVVGLLLRQGLQLLGVGTAIGLRGR